MPTTADIIIIGAGCMGTSLAWQLARRGAGRILLLDKAGLAAGASGKTGAIVRTHYTHPVLARMALKALRLFERFPDEVGAPSPVFTRTGFLVLMSKADAPTLAATVAMHRDLGINAHYLTPDRLTDIEPRATPEGIGGVAWEPESGYCDPVAVTTGFARAAHQLGVEVRPTDGALRLLVEDGVVQGVETRSETLQSPVVVIAAGYRSRDLLADIGIDLPMTPLRHDLAFVQHAPGFGGPHPVISDRVGGCFFRPEAQSITRIGTTAPYDGYVDEDVERDAPPSAHERERLAAGFRLRFPAGGTLIGRGISCTYDCTPDLQPVLGPVPDIDGLHVAAGFSGHGFKLSPVVGEALAEQITTGRSNEFNLDLFSLARFAEGRLIVPEISYQAATLS